MCIGITGWLSSIDHLKQFDLIPFQNSGELSKYPAINPADCEHELHLISENGKVLKGADAILEIWSKTGHWSSFMTSVFRLPPFIWLARPLYRLIAKYRKRIF